MLTNAILAALCAGAWVVTAAPITGADCLLGEESCIVAAREKFQVLQLRETSRTSGDYWIDLFDNLQPLPDPQSTPQPFASLSSVSSAPLETQSPKSKQPSPSAPGLDVSSDKFATAVEDTTPSFRYGISQQTSRHHIADLGITTAFVQGFFEGIVAIAIGLAVLASLYAVKARIIARLRGEWPGSWEGSPSNITRQSAVGDHSESSPGSVVHSQRRSGSKAGRLPEVLLCKSEQLDSRWGNQSYHGP